MIIKQVKARYNKQRSIRKIPFFKVFLVLLFVMVLSLYSLFLFYFGGKLQYPHPKEFQSIYHIVYTKAINLLKGAHPSRPKSANKQTNRDQQVINSKQNNIDIQNKPYPKLKANLTSKSNRELVVSVVNIVDSPIKVTRLSSTQGDFYPEQTKSMQFNHPKIIIESGDSKQIRFRFPKDDIPLNLDIERLKLVYETKSIQEETAVNLSVKLKQHLLLSPLMQRPNFRDFGFLTIDDTNRKVIIKTGKYVLNSNLIFPKGYTIFVEEGVKINLLNKAKIISFSPLWLSGSKDYPISIYSNDTTGQGLVVLKAGSLSKVNHVKFEGLSNPDENGWQLTGAVTFYESDVEVSNSIFSNNRSEDSLNIIRSEFTIENTEFRNAQSDAFDADFSNGSIISSRFINSKNDAVDVSGSVVKLANLVVDGSGDKGVSAGEDSQVDLKNMTIENAVIGVASKDLSKVEIDKISINNCKVGYAAYQKKTEFGPGFISAIASKIANTEILAFAEHNSTVIINGDTVANSSEGIDISTLNL